MNEFKGTPGPWRKDDGSNENVDDTYHSIRAGLGFYDSNKSVGFELTGFCSQSDANLIAAAPDLLFALQEITVHLDSIKKYSNDDYYINQAQQAINKALNQ